MKKETNTVEDTLRTRETQYGSYNDVATIAIAFQDIMEDSINWPNAPAPIKLALIAIVGKIARMLNGDIMYPDNFHDIGGYAALAEQYITEFKY